MAMRFKWSEEKIAQFQREGRGKGTGSQYKPWIRVADSSSQGISRRAFSQKTGRHHELLSNVEWHLFVLLEFSPDVVDIREQFPLSREETQSIAAQRCIKHPVYPGTAVPTVMTVDFLVKLKRQGNESLEAFSCKTADDLEKPRTLEKLELERAFFDDLGIPHRLVIDTELPTTKLKNLLWFRGATLDGDSESEYPAALRELGHRMAHELSRGVARGTLAEYCANFDARVGMQTGTGLRVARALLWEGTLQTDLNQPDLPAAPVSLFQAVQRTSMRVVGG